MTDSDSDLTPQSSDNEEDDDSMQIEQDLTPKRTKKNDIMPKSHDRKGKGKADEPAKYKETGPRGRERKRNTKMEEVERRRARDAKFDDSNLASVRPSVVVWTDPVVILASTLQDCRPRRRILLWRR